LAIYEAPSVEKNTNLRAVMALNRPKCRK